MQSARHPGQAAGLSAHVSHVQGRGDEGRIVSERQRGLTSTQRDRYRRCFGDCSYSSRIEPVSQGSPLRAVVNLSTAPRSQQPQRVVDLDYPSMAVVSTTYLYWELFTRAGADDLCVRHTRPQRHPQLGDVPVRTKVRPSPR
nr:hypothetical protein [Micromonospora sp. WMMB235]